MYLSTAAAATRFGELLRERYCREDERGASLVEYGLLVTLIAIACLVAILVFGEETSESFKSTSKSISDV